MNKLLRFSLLTLFAVLFSGNVLADEFSWDLSKKTYSAASEDQVTWTSDYVTMVADKADATTKANNYLGGDASSHTSSRFYSGSKVTITPATNITISKVEFTATTEGYATALKNSTWTNATAAVSGKTVTITPTDGTAAFSAAIGATTGHTKVVVTYTNAGDTRVDANLSFSATTATATTGEAFTAPTLTNPNNVAVEYSSSNTDAATVDATTGAVTIVAAGTTTITAKVPASNTEYKGSASYQLTVKAATESVTLPYSEVFKGKGIGKFTIENVTLAEGMTYVWNYVASYGMKASAYVSGACKATEAWLISPLIDMTSAASPTLSFDHMINKFGTVDLAKANTSVWVREGETGTWTELTGITYPTAESNNFSNAGTISLSSFKGKKIQIGFKYTSTTECAGTWEIQNFTVVDGQPANLSWSKATFTAIIGDETIVFPTLSNPNNLSVTYTSSNQAVATIDTSGEISLEGEGETTITATFAGNESFNAGEASYKLTVQDGTVKGGKYNPYTVSEIQALDPDALPTEKKWVKGFIAGCAVTDGAGLAEENVASNIALAQSGDVTSYIPVALPNGTVRTALNLVDNPANLGKEVKVYGTIEKYFNITGVKNVTSYEFTGESTTIHDLTGINTISVDDVNAPAYNVAGQRVNDGYKGVIIKNGKKFLSK